MSDSRVPTEVELVYEVMPCNSMRSTQEPGKGFAHACAYFRRWGRYHSYDYVRDGPPAQPGIVHSTRYVGRAALVPEILSGCRKAPIMAVGINPNLPGWWAATRRALNPVFDDYKQYAHYFRWRTTDKLQIRKADYEGYLGGQDDSPLNDHELSLPAGEDEIAVELMPMKMYRNYQSLLDDMATEMGWHGHALSIGEDVSYGNMVACPSAKWLNKPDASAPEMPAMTPAQQKTIVSECFHERQYFLRQMFQSLPSVVMVFSQSTADAFLGEMRGRFIQGDPKPGDSIEDLLDQEIRLRYGTLPDGTALEARVIFSPHITGNPSTFEAARKRVLAQLVQEARGNRLVLNPATGHLQRPRGSCSFCPTLEIGACDYVAELRPLDAAPDLDGGFAALPGVVPSDKKVQARLLERFLALAPPATAAGLTDGGAEADGWTLSGDPSRQADRTAAVQPPGGGAT